MKEKKKQSDQHPFQIDKDYFDKLENSILDKVEGGKYHLPLGLSHPFKAPDGYLENFSVKKEAILELGIEHPYLAPEGYFRQLDAKVLKQINLVHKEGLKLQVSWKNYATYSRIAAIVILTGLVSLLFFGNPFVQQTEELSFSSLHSDDILTYLEEENLAFDDFAEVISLENDFTLEQKEEVDIQEYTEDELLELIDFQFANEI